MTIEQLRRHLEQRPFKPFDIHLADGRSLPVEHPELMARSPSGRTALLFIDEGTVETIDLLLVTSLTERSNGSHKRRRPRGS
jgi:hypothetical protein